MSSDIVYVNIMLATTGDVVDGNNISPGIYCMIGNYVFKSLGRQVATVMECIGALRGADGRYTIGARVMIPMEPYPVTYIGHEAAAQMLLNLERSDA